MSDDTSDVVNRARYWLDDSPDGGMYSIESSITHDLVEDLADEIERLRAVLNRPPVHLVKVTLTGWTIQHPPTCGDLFDCAYTATAGMWDSMPASEPGVYVMDLSGEVAPWENPDA